MREKFLFLIFFMLIFYRACFAEPITNSGQVAAWAVSSTNNAPQTGIRYIPSFHYTSPIDDIKKINYDLSFNLNTYVPLDHWRYVKGNTNTKQYRATIAYSTSDFEIRTGLQKINFGPAKILRSMRWFDNLDYRDPIQLTYGVYSVLTRRYFKNNANLWIWGLYKNNGLMGNETYKTNYNSVEFGGRFQQPLRKGELGFSYHQRQVSPFDWNSKMPTTPMTNGLDNRYGLDGFWDIGPGVWFEASVDKIYVNSTTSLWQEFLTLGTDYTFDIGPGVHVMFEHFINSQGPQANKNQTNLYELSALECDFSLNLADKLTGVMYYDWIGKKCYPYLNLQRTYDNWQYNLLVFSTQKTSDVTFSGSGAMFMAVYNY